MRSHFSSLSTSLEYPREGPSMPVSMYAAVILDIFQNILFVFYSLSFLIKCSGYTNCTDFCIYPWVAWNLIWSHVIII